MSGLTRDNKARDSVISPKSAKIDLSRFIVNCTTAQTHTRTFHVSPRYCGISRRVFGDGRGPSEVQNSGIIMIFYLIEIFFFLNVCCRINETRINDYNT